MVKRKKQLVLHLHWRKTYRIKVTGGSPTSGFKPIDKTTVGFAMILLMVMMRMDYLELKKLKFFKNQMLCTKTTISYKVVKISQKPNASTDAFWDSCHWEHVEFPRWKLHY